MCVCVCVVWKEFLYSSVCQGVCTVSGCDPTGEGVSYVCFLFWVTRGYFLFALMEKKTTVSKWTKPKPRVTHHRTEIEKSSSDSGEERSQNVLRVLETPDSCKKQKQKTSGCTWNKWLYRYMEHLQAAHQVFCTLSVSRCVHGPAHPCRI